MTTPESDISLPATPTSASGAQAWWRHAVIYQIYPRSWADGNGDGVGDLPGIIERLPYLRDLGVDAVWLSPFYVSPMADAGYDVADYTQVDPVFGTLDDAERLIATAHELDLRVIVDLVPNHSSDQHVWFQEALAAGPGSPERTRYIFREGRGPGGSEPPNNWLSVFGGPAWTRVTEPDGSADSSTPAQWYLHLFAPEQPDFDWNNREVAEFFLDVLRFWLDRGVDGFRVDVAHGLIKADGLPDAVRSVGMLGSDSAAPDGTPIPATEESTDTRGVDELDVGHAGPMWDQDGVHEIYREWRALLNSYNTTGDTANDRILCAEAWVHPLERAARYVRSDEMHQSFNFEFLESAWDPATLRTVITDSLRIAGDVGAPSTWVLSNHDVVRHASRLGLPTGRSRPNGIGEGDEQPNAVLGLRRARAATALMLALPGSAYIYQGEELGLPDHTALPDAVRQDPTFARAEGAELGRDGCRIPFPWEAGSVAYGFGESWDTWLPQPEVYGPLAADRQEGVAGSTLELYRTLLHLRRELALGSATLTWADDTDDDVLAFDAETERSGMIRVVTNFGHRPIALPRGVEVLASSSPAPGGVITHLERDATAWLRLS